MARLDSISARNVHRSYLLDRASMASDQVSILVDWKEMAVGSIQAQWSGNDAVDAKILVEVSNVPEEDWFDVYDICEINNEFILDDDNSGYGTKKTKLFNLGVIGFRYARIVYLAGSNTTGTITAIALGKKNG